MKLHLEPVNLTLEVSGIADLYQQRAHDKDIAFRLSIDIGSSYWVRTDAACIRQVLHKLLGNATRFTERGFVELRVFKSGRTIVFEVTDTGLGIAAGDLPHLFETFRQVDETDAKAAIGIGGLGPARQLARAMGGEIGVSSFVGLGSRFAFAAVLPELASLEVPTGCDPGRPTPNARSGFQILLVEGDEANVSIATSHLDRLGVVTIRASGHKQGVEAAFGIERPDLILMECRIPNMDGLSASREIRQVEKAAGMPRVPIVALAQSPSADDRRECFEAGMDGFLSKPFNDIQVLEAIRIFADDATSERMRGHPLYKPPAAPEDIDPDCRPQKVLH